MKLSNGLHVTACKCGRSVISRTGGKKICKDCSFKKKWGKR